MTLGDPSASETDTRFEAALILVQLLSGLTTWETFQALPFSISRVRGKRGCRWGFASCYIGCRYLSFTSVICWMVALAGTGRFKSKSLDYIHRITYFLSLGFAANILTARIISRRNNGILHLFAVFLAFVQWVLVITALSTLPHLGTMSLFTTLIAAYLTLIACITLVFSLWQLHFSPARRDAEPSLPSSQTKTPEPVSVFQRVCDADIVELGITCILRTAALVVVIIMADVRGYLCLSVEVVAFALSMICICRIYERMDAARQTCPMATVPFLSKVIIPKANAARARLDGGPASHSRAGSLSLQIASLRSLAVPQHDSVELHTFVDRSALKTPSGASSASPSSSTLPC